MRNQPTDADRILGLISQPAAYEILRGLHLRGGSAAVADVLPARSPDRLAILRSLVAELLVVSAEAGSWDSVDDPGSLVALTGFGRRLASSLSDLEASTTPSPCTRNQRRYQR